MVQHLFYPTANLFGYQFEQAKKKSKKAGTSKKEKQKEEAPADAETEATASLVADEPAPETAAAAEDTTVEPASPTQTIASLSKLRSSSFRQGPLSPTLSPEGETAADIYRKQVARIEDLEKENKRLAKEASDAEKRYKKAEEELADLQEADREGSDTSQIEKLVGWTHACLALGLALTSLCRKPRSLPSKGTIRSSSRPLRNAMARRLLCL